VIAPPRDPGPHPLIQHARAAQTAAKSTSDRAGIAWRFCVMVCRATGCSQALTNIWHVWPALRPIY